MVHLQLELRGERTRQGEYEVDELARGQVDGQLLRRIVLMQRVGRARDVLEIETVGLAAAAVAAGVAGANRRLVVA